MELRFLSPFIILLLALSINQSHCGLLDKSKPDGSALRLKSDDVRSDSSHVTQLSWNPRKKSEEALDLYSRMIEAGCEPSVHTCNMLIEMFFVMDDPDGAFKTWQDMEIRGCFSDANTYCVMIKGLFKCNKADDALYLLGDVFTRGIKLPFQRFDSFMMQLS
ncbi:hypothetical protein Droror1_Dr00020836 [Drosera rotundifolia]